MRMAFFQVDADPDTSIPPFCRLGFVFEGEGRTPISFDFLEGYSQYFQSLQFPNGTVIYPEVGRRFEFLLLPYPAIYSMAVEIDTSK